MYTAQRHRGHRGHIARVWRAGQGCIGRGGRYPPPPSRAPSLSPATVPLTARASFNGICNRQYRPPTALATSSNRLSNRLWGRLCHGSSSWCVSAPQPIAEQRTLRTSSTESAAFPWGQRPPSYQALANTPVVSSAHLIDGIKPEEQNGSHVSAHLFPSNAPLGPAAHRGKGQQVGDRGASRSGTRRRLHGPGFRLLRRRGAGAVAVFERHGIAAVHTASRAQL